MFTGIVEALGEVVDVKRSENTIDLTVRSSISSELRPDQSVAHDGVCLTVVAVSKDTHTVQLVEETLNRSHFRAIGAGSLLNLERSVPASGRFEGHFVQGHVDGTGQLLSRDREIWTFRFPQKYARFLVEKGSVCINGISLTVVYVKGDTFSVALIPYTLENTNIDKLIPGASVNLEFDMIAKHVERLLQERGLF
jgi:riboflavin synthase